MPERIVLTGAGGFLGQPLLQALHSAGFRTRGIYGPDDPAELNSPEDYQCDINQESILRFAVAEADIVVHLAGPPSVADSFAEPARPLRDHAVGTATLLAALRHTDLHRFVYISSAEVYGQPNQNPASEDTPLCPLSPYAAAKLAAEVLVTANAIERRYQATIMRPFTLFGPRLRDGSLINRILQSAVSNQPVSVMDLTVIRDYLWVEDAVEAIVLACTTRQTTQVAVYNLGSGIGHSVADIVSTARKLTGSTAPVTATGRRDRPAALDITCLVASIGRIESGLCWRPKTSLEEGLGALLGETSGKSARE